LCIPRNFGKFYVLKIPLQNCYYVSRLRILEYFISGKVLMKVNQSVKKYGHFYS
jgi:hypothetical protein